MHKPAISWQELVLSQGTDWVERQNREMERGPQTFLEPDGPQQQPQGCGHVVPIDLSDYFGQAVDADAAPDICRELGIHMPTLPQEPSPLQIRTVADIVAWFREADEDLRKRCLEELKPYLPRPQEV